MIEWNKLGLNIHNSKSLTSFKGKILKFIRPSGNSTFLCNNPKEIQLLTRLRLGLSHLQDHKFNHNFQDNLNPICNCGENETPALLNVIHLENSNEIKTSKLEKGNMKKYFVAHQTNSKLIYGPSIYA